MSFMRINSFGVFYFLFPLSVGVVFQLFPLIGWNLEFIPGDLGDTRFNIFVLEHGFQFLSGQVDSFWSAGFMHPEPEVISLSDNLLGTMPIYAFFRVLGADIFTAFQFWMVVLTVLNYVTSFQLIHFITKNPAAASLGAFVFCFSIGLAAQMNHAQMYPRFAVPLTIYFALLWLKDFQPNYFILALSFQVYLFYCGIYLGFMGLIPFAAIVGGTIWLKRRDLFDHLRIRYNFLSYGIGLVLNGVALMALFLPYLRRAKISELHDYQQIVQSIPTPKSFVSAFPGNPIHGVLENTTIHYPAFWDHWIFPGWMALFGFVAVCGVMLYTKSILLNRRVLLLIGASAIVTALCFLRFGEASVYSVLHKLPGFGAMRSLTRIITIELLFMGIGVAIIYLWVMNKKIGKTWVSFLLFMGLLFVDNYLPGDKLLRMEKQEMVSRHESMRARFAGITPGTVVSYEPIEFSGDVAHLQLDVMLAAQSLQLKSINGYSGSAALDFWKYWLAPNEENRLFYLNRFDQDQMGEVMVID